MFTAITNAITHQGSFYARFRVSKMVGLLKLTEDSVKFVILDEIKKLVLKLNNFFSFLIATQAPHLLQAKIWIIILTAWFLMHDAWKLYVTFTRLNLYLTLTSSNCTSKKIFAKPLKKSQQIALVYKRNFVVNFYVGAIKVNLQYFNFSLNFAIFLYNWNRMVKGQSKM